MFGQARKVAGAGISQALRILPPDIGDHSLGRPHYQALCSYSSGQNMLHRCTRRASYLGSVPILKSSEATPVRSCAPAVQAGIG
eukprot:154959-Pleurochrysis_carterae.AAC.6